MLSWQNVFLRAPIVAGTTTEAVLSTLAGVSVYGQKCVVEIKLKAVFPDGSGPTHWYLTTHPIT